MHAHSAHDHAHDHGHAHHHHHHHHASPGGRYSIALALNLGFVIVETAAGFWSNSTALLSDAAHNLSDVLGLVLAGGAAWLAARAAANTQRTYGYGKTTVLAALANALLLVLASGALGWEAARRLMAPEPIMPGVVMAAAALGVAINGGTALLFMRSSKHDINARGAFLHMAADAGVSLAVIVAGFLVWQTGAAWIDPAVSVAVVLVILWSTWGLLRDSFRLATDSAPAHIDVGAVREHLAALPGVEAVHDLHVWAMSSSETALTAHLIRKQDGGDEFLRALNESVRARFGIGHVTVQIERERHDDCGGHA